MRRYNISAKGSAIRELSLNTAKPKAILYLFYFYMLSPVPLTNARDRPRVQNTGFSPAHMTLTVAAVGMKHASSIQIMGVFCSVFFQYKNY